MNRVDCGMIRPAFGEDLDALQELASAAAWGLCAQDYTPEQIATALRYGLGVDKQNIADGTYFYRYDRNVATFTVMPTVSVGGTIAPDTPQSVDEGSTTSFTVTPNASFQIGSVAGCGGSLAGHLYTTGAISADCTVSAVFVGTGDIIFRNGFDP